MTRSTGKRKHHCKGGYPKDPAIKPFGEWLPANQGFFKNFCTWLQDGGYSFSAVHIYGVAARLALGYPDKPYWTIDPDADLDRVSQHLETRPLTPGTRSNYRKGLLKLAEYLRLVCNRPSRERPINWAYYTGLLPDWLTEHVRDYLFHCRRNWRPDQVHRSTLNLLGRLTIILRWMAARVMLSCLGDITPDLWFDYLEARLSEDIKPVTLNHHLSCLQTFLTFLDEVGHPICQRMLLVDPLDEGTRLPQDVPPEQLRKLYLEIQKAANHRHNGVRRTGLLDTTWSLLMLHCGLRTCEVRRLRLSDIDWETRRVRIEQSKGFKDRIVYLSQAASDALQAYLSVRGPAEALSDHVFIYRHKPLSGRYCQVRLRTYGKRCGVGISPHKIRHSCATLLLNAGAPVVTVQTLLGHKYVDTTLKYARLYDGTVATEYYRAMEQVESRLALVEVDERKPLNPDRLLALVDSLSESLLEEEQSEMLQTLRTGILALVQ